MLKYYTRIKAIPFTGGANTYLDKPLLGFGQYSMVQNLRGLHPGFVKRPGCKKQHSTADSTNKVLSMYQFKKADVSEKHFFAQMSDGDILEATNHPPAVTTGAFGSEAYSGSANQIAASWTNINDMLFHSNGVDQHQIYGGDSSYVKQFIVYKGTAIPSVPELGEDYSTEVSDGNASTVAVLDDLSTVANFDCLFIRVPVPAKSFTFTVPAGNDNASVMTINYRKNDNTWAATSGLSDGTDVAGDSMKQSGTASFTEPTDLISKFMFGANGFWYQIVFSAALDGEVEVSSVTFDSSFQDMVNIWDGAETDAVEVQVEGTTAYQVFASGSVDIDALAATKKIMIAATDPIEGIYIDPGDTPNATGTGLTSLKYFDGNSFESVGSVTDGTSGMSNAGWLTFPRKAAQPHSFGGSVYAYWYELVWDAQLSASTVIAITLMPYYDITDFGTGGYTSCAWKNRLCTSYNQYGSDIYIGQEGNPMAMNGIDFSILRAGDGRLNKVIAQRNFHNDLMVWQEEKGAEGGCVTIFEGYDPVTYGKLVLSSKIGAMNNKSVIVVDGVMTSVEGEEGAGDALKMAFWLSRYGICASDGTSISVISDDIRDYFDPTNANCIRRGYESEMWMAYDSAFNVIRVGLVSGSSATVPNVFPVFDLTDKVWTFDVLAQELSCMTEVDGESGAIPVLQMGGGVDDGFIYQLNTTFNDVSTAINAYVDIELDADGEILLLSEMLLRCKVQAAGDITVTFTKVDTNNQTKTISMTAAKTNETIRRHRFNLNVRDQHITVRIAHATASQSMTLHDHGYTSKIWKNA